MVCMPSDLEELFISVATTVVSHSSPLKSKVRDSMQSRAEDVVPLFRQQQKLLTALEKLEAGPSYNIPQSVKTDYSKQPVSQ